MIITGASEESPKTSGNPLAHDALVPGTHYHATGEVSCSMGNAPAGSQQCSFGVIRGQPGYAEFEVTPPGGMKRVLIFDGAKVIAGGSDNTHGPRRRRGG